MPALFPFALVANPQVLSKLMVQCNPNDVFIKIFNTNMRLRFFLIFCFFASCRALFKVGSEETIMGQAAKIAMYLFDNGYYYRRLAQHITVSVNAKLR